MDLLKETPAQVEAHLHRSADSRHAGESTDVAEIDRHALVFFGFDRQPLHQLTGHRPEAQ